MILKSSKITVISIILACISISAFCGGSQESRPQEASYTGTEGRITVYLSGPAVMLDSLEKTFEKDRGDVLEFVHMGCGPLRQRVWAEMESGAINADVFWGSDPLIYEALESRGALRAYKPQGFENLNPRYQIDAAYTLVNERYGVVIYNKDKITEAPSSFADLLDGKYSGDLAHADPSLSSTATALVAGLWNLKPEGGTFHKALAANGLFLTKKNSDVPSKIQEGEFAAGIAPHDAVLRLQKKAKKEGYPTPLAICWPEEGCLAIVRPIAISMNPARPEVNERLAEEFVDFMISEKAQKITSKFSFVSLLNGAEKPKGIPKNIKVITPDWVDISKVQEKINADFKMFFN